MDNPEETLTPAATGAESTRQSGQAQFDCTTSVDPTAAFREAMAEAGIVPDRSIQPTGELARFHIEGDKPGSHNGWAVLHADGVPSGAFGSWKEGVTHTWSAKARQDLTEAERARQRERIRQAKAERDRQRRESQGQAAIRAWEKWDKARPADPGHPYLRAKRIPPLRARQKGDALVLPVIDFDRQLTSLQFIGGGGNKLLLANGRKSGCFIPVAKPKNPARVLICEGWSTGATLAESNPADVVLAAVDAGNLKPVATGARNQWPDSEILVCGDDDRRTPGNPGATKAREAAIAAGALMAFPQWPDDAPDTLTDFNDLARWLREGGYE